MSISEKQAILIMDDSLLIYEQIKTALKEESIIICEVHNGLKAQEQLRQCQLDLILLDVAPPGADGYELYRILQDLDRKDAVIIFLTSRSSDEDVVKGFSIGACDYIKKPFVEKELQSRVRVYLIQKKQRDDLDRQNRELCNNMEKPNYMAYRDGFTGLYNRRYVVGDLMEDMRSYGQDEVETVFIMVDIDDFKQMSNTYGHDVGDMALVCIANTLELNCHRHRVVRWGGEESLSILFNVTKDEVYELNEKVCRQVEQFVIPYGDKGFFYAVTLGLYTFHEQEGLEEEIGCADKVLYHGRRRGKNQSVWYREQ